MQRRSCRRSKLVLRYGVPYIPQLGAIKPHNLIFFSKLTALRSLHRTLIRNTRSTRFSAGCELCSVSVYFTAEAVYIVNIRMEHIKLPLSEWNASWVFDSFTRTAFIGSKVLLDSGSPSPEMEAYGEAASLAWIGVSSGKKRSLFFVCIMPEAQIGISCNIRRNCKLV